MFVRKH